MDVPGPLRESYEALNRGDLDAWLAGIHEDAELHELAEMPDTAVYRGHGELREWAAGGMAHLSDWEWMPEEVLRQGDGVLLVQIRFRGHGAESGAPFEQTLFHLIEFRDGRASRMRGFLDREQALAAAG